MSKLPLPLNSLKAIALELVTIYNSREDYEKKTGKPCPEFAINVPVKMWQVPLSAQLWFSYLMAMLQGGKPVVESGRLPASYAASVNIPPDKFVADGPPILAELPFPIRSLEQDEELCLAMGGLGYPSSGATILVKNKTLWDAYQQQQPPPAGTQELKALVQECLSLLRKLVGA